MDEFSVAPNGTSSSLFAKKICPVLLLIPRNYSHLFKWSNHIRKLPLSLSQETYQQLPDIIIQSRRQCSAPVTDLYFGGCETDRRLLTQSNQVFSVDNGIHGASEPVIFSTSTRGGNQPGNYRHGSRATNNIPGITITNTWLPSLQHHRWRLRLFHSVDNCSIRYPHSRLQVRRSGQMQHNISTLPAGRFLIFRTVDYHRGFGYRFIFRYYYHAIFSSIFDYNELFGRCGRNTGRANFYCRRIWFTAKLKTLTIQPQGLWIDSSAPINSITALLSGTTSSERWQTNGSLTGDIISSSIINIPYYHQYYITISRNRPPAALFHS